VTRPEVPVRTPRATEIVSAARRILEDEGRDALTMRRLASSLGMKAPSLYKHFPTKRALEAALIEQGLLDLGELLHLALARRGRGSATHRLLTAYRAAALANPELYRLSTSGALPSRALPRELEEWAGEPFYLATGDPWQAQALFAFAHGMVILELDDRFPPGSDLRRTWRAGTRAFEP
jgi:AcrR family transcriptional regulator